MTTRPELTFPRDCHAFFRALAKHNDPAWFAAHRDRYEAAVVAPAREFVERIGPRLARLLPGVQADPRADGQGSIVRIRRDARFAAGQPPYRTALRLLFWQGERALRWQVPAFHIELAPGRVEIAAGVRRFDPADLPAFREACGDARLHSLLAELETLEFEIGELRYKRLPRDHAPVGEPTDTLRRHGGLVAAFRRRLLTRECGQDFLDECVGTFRELAPLNRWLARALRTRTP